MPADGWDQQNQPGAFARPPQQPVEQRGALGDTLSSAPARPSQADYDVYTLPESVMDSTTWRGSDADRTFGMREPTAAELQRLFKGENQSDAMLVPHFIVQIGEQPVSDYTTAQAWFARLSVKAQNLVSVLMLESFMPTEEEGNALRASRRRSRLARNG